MVMNKKGQNLTLGTIILIVLGISVLVFLIFGFSTGWNNMWGKITNLGGGKVNVNVVEQACALSCATANKADFCLVKKTLNYPDAAGNKGVSTWMDTCAALSGVSGGKSGAGAAPGSGSAGVTLVFAAGNSTIQPCPAITC